MTELRYWYIHFSGEKATGWRLWVGRHPLDRLVECPDQVPTFWQEVPTDVGNDLINKMNHISIEEDKRAGN